MHVSKRFDVMGTVRNFLRTKQGKVGWSLSDSFLKVVIKCQLLCTASVGGNMEYKVWLLFAAASPSNPDALVFGASTTS